MKKNFLQKRKCNSLPGSSALAAVKRTDGLTESRHPREIPAQRPRKKRGPIQRRVILSISDDLEFDKRLRTAALPRGQIVIRVESVEAALRIVDSECCGVILIDLDFAGKTAWELAGGLLEVRACPPVILLTGQCEQFDLRMAVMAGSIFEKSGNTGQVLRIVGDLLEAPLAEAARRSLTQHGIIRRLTPTTDPAPLIPVHRFGEFSE